jgi:signal transduction histidine kinase
MACEPNFPALLADGRVLRQIVINLVSNALKFTPEGGRILVSAESDPRGGCTIFVEDTGCGISEEDLAIVTEPFVQVENALGLSLVKKYTALHGGELEIESVVDRGTKISVRLPAERVICAEIPSTARKSA